MSATVEQLGPTRVRIDFDVPDADLDESLRAPDRGTSGLAGFRRGRLPALDGHGAAAVLLAQPEAALLALVLAGAARHDLEVLGRVDIDDVAHTPAGDLRFVATLDVRPEVVLPDLSSVVVTVLAPVIADDEVTEQVERLWEQFATPADVDRAAAEGDIVHLDLRSRVGQATVAGGSVTGVPHEVGAGWPLARLDPAVFGIGQLPAVLDPALIGLRAGESTEVTTRLVGGVHAGRDSTVTVTVTGVVERILPDLDDGFAGAALGAGATVADVRAMVRDELVKARLAQQRNAVRNQLLAHVAAVAEVPAPEGVLADEVQARKDSLRAELLRVGTSVEAYLAATGTPADFLDRDIEAAASVRIRGQLVLDALAAAEGLQVTPGEIQEIAAGRTGGVTLDQCTTDIRRGKALAILLHRVSLVDEHGNPVTLAELRRTS